MAPAPINAYIYLARNLNSDVNAIKNFLEILENNEDSRIHFTNRVQSEGGPRPESFNGLLYIVRTYQFDMEKSLEFLDHLQSNEDARRYFMYLINNEGRQNNRRNDGRTVHIQRGRFAHGSRGL